MQPNAFSIFCVESVFIAQVNYEQTLLSAIHHISNVNSITTKCNIAVTYRNRTHFLSTSFVYQKNSKTIRTKSPKNESSLFPPIKNFDVPTIIYNFRTTISLLIRGNADLCLPNQMLVAVRTY